jgi:hypothetical protein
VQYVVEVETGESVNHLEALAEWAHFSRLRAPFHLYVPAGMVDVARRLAEDNNIYVSEIWSYHAVGDQMRFTMVYRNKETPPPMPKPAPKPVPKPAVPAPKELKPVAKPPAKVAKLPVKTVKAVKAVPKKGSPSAKKKAAPKKPAAKKAAPRKAASKKK